MLAQFCQHRIVVNIVELLKHHTFRENRNTQRTSFPNLVPSVFGIYQQTVIQRIVLFFQNRKHFVRSELQKITLDMLALMDASHLPDKVDMRVHQYESVKVYPFRGDKMLKAGDYDFFAPFVF